MSVYENAYLVGNHFRDEQAKLVYKALALGSKLRLQREPENEYDQYAIKVLFEGVHLGYVNAKPVGTNYNGTAAWLAPELDDLMIEHDLPSDEPFPEELVDCEVIEFDTIKNNTYAVMRIEVL